MALVSRRCKCHKRRFGSVFFIPPHLAFMQAEATPIGQCPPGESCKGRGGTGISSGNLVPQTWLTMLLTEAHQNLARAVFEEDVRPP
jgi:hypothetical protein